MKKNIMGRCRAFLVAALPLTVIMVAAFFSPLTCRAQEAHGGDEAVPDIVGTWVGARLQCRKDESGPVKCGTPTPFEISFRADGTGTAKGETFPPAFVFRQEGADKIVISTANGSKKLELFGLSVEEGFISFQAYIFPEGAKEEGEEYIHYVFDMALQEP